MTKYAYKVTAQLVIIIFAMFIFISADCGVRPMCAMFCQYGFESDTYGCPVCKCKESNVTCSLAMCQLYCQFGFQKDKNGCPVCKCVNPPPTTTPVPTTAKVCPMCMMECPLGFRDGDDGCPKCECKTSVCEVNIFDIIVFCFFYRVR